MGTSISSKNWFQSEYECISICKNVGYHLVKQVGVALVEKHLIYITSFVDP